MPCSDNRYGSLCSKNCTCDEENTQQCNNENGFCVCKENHYGVNCEHFCDPEKNNLICSNNSTHHCTCELTLAQKYVKLEEELEAHRQFLENFNEQFDDLSHYVDKNVTAKQNKERIEKIALQLEEIDSELKRQGSHPFATFSIVLLVFCLISYVVYRAVTSYGPFEGDKAAVRYSRRSRDTFDNPIYTTSDTLLADETRFVRENRPNGLKGFRNPFRSSRLLDKLSKFHLTENPFRSRSQNPAGDDAKRSPTEGNELKDVEIYSTIDIAKETKNDEIIRLP